MKFKRTLYLSPLVSLLIACSGPTERSAASGTTSASEASQAAAAGAGEPAGLRAPSDHHTYAYTLASSEARPGSRNRIARTKPARLPTQAATISAGPAQVHSAQAAAATYAASGSGAANTLVLYDTSGDWGYLGELNAAALGTLASHFGSWKAAPVTSYQAGDLEAYTALIYVGSSYDEPLPDAFLTDVAAGSRPVLWIDENIGQLASHEPSFASRYGFTPGSYDTGAIGSVSYKGAVLTREPSNNAGIMTFSSLSAPSVTLAEASRDDGTSLPWAVRSGNLTYIAENPLMYNDLSDRFLALCDLLFDALAPETPERHRALVRIEDVSATTNPDGLRALADYLASENVPFSVATIPSYQDPLGANNNGEPQSVLLHEAPDVVDALKYMVTKGGALIMHGYTHQYSNVKNPYSAVSAADFEFYRTHLDDQQTLVWDGPVPEDSSSWASARFAAGLAEFDAAGLTKPTVFEWPHYAASVTDSLALRQSFGSVYHQLVYYTGILSGGQPQYDGNHEISLFVPYTVQDAYGFRVIPEDLGCYASDQFYQNPPRSPADIVRDAQRDLVVRDGVASFFFHPYYDVAQLQAIVSGIKAAGYEFVAADAL